MKEIEFHVRYQSPSGRPVDNAIDVVARDINSGFRKATDKAIKDAARGWEIVRVEFWQVKS